MSSKKSLMVFSVLCGILISFIINARETIEKEIKIIEISENIHMLMGIGGNIAVSSGTDGVFIIDDDMPPIATNIEAAVRSIQDEPVRMVFNTHWHFDHTGGNKHFGEQGALIVAHDNVRERMSKRQYSTLFNTETKPSPDLALPVVTFDQSISFHLNGGTIRALHLPFGHTDGDAVLFFEEANIVHMGDLFFNRMYPVIDISAGGSAQGMIAAITAVLPMLNKDTVIIPGHGPVGDINDLKAFREMLMIVTNRAQLLIDEGKTLEEITALSPTFNYDDTWAWEFMPPQRFIKLIYDSVAATSKATTQKLTN
ncbi:MAG: MBL fold metallo-hydrolase [Gammaproteobacteria bacterium]|nr:MBL fold metallo-hydrolase [Gammaproteobacteria bacterium]MCP4090456.1 MBL fold metallo-hydrolase [Gammaproteobacteria bacterium]MCP4275431.1 MBL fold metallo-hydrolase [Gammaproteobacteria bacterium]MCP4832592.1 MBL fold metallo-hydrolase [Gammaproteobacteria bacterium]MCP4928111.1 MBL fold metallo-hydrolase [Gammaproteobacteria bacterium]